MLYISGNSLSANLTYIIHDGIGQLEGLEVHKWSSIHVMRKLLDWENRSVRVGRHEEVVLLLAGVIGY